MPTPSISSIPASAAKTAKRPRVHPKKTEAERCTERVPVLMTKDMLYIVRKLANRRCTTVARVIRNALGVVVQAEAERERYREYLRRNGISPSRMWPSPRRRHNPVLPDGPKPADRQPSIAELATALSLLLDRW